MIKQTRLPAFTLIELMVTMLISSISIGIIYSGYDIVSKQFRTYKTTNETIAEALYLNSLMNSDFSKARDAKKNRDGFTLLDYENRSTVYEFSEEYIVRKVSFSTDTFHLPIKNSSYSISGKDVLEDLSWIDEVSFDVTINKEVTSFHYKKEYDAAFLIDHEDEIVQ